MFEMRYMGLPKGSSICFQPQPQLWYNSLGKYQILSIDKAGLSINKTCSKCDSFQLYQWSGRIRDNLLAAYGKSIIL